MNMKLTQPSPAMASGRMPAALALSANAKNSSQVLGAAVAPIFFIASLPSHITFWRCTLTGHRHVVLAAHLGVALQRRGQHGVTVALADQVVQVGHVIGVGGIGPHVRVDHRGIRRAALAGAGLEQGALVVGTAHGQVLPRHALGGERLFELGQGGYVQRPDGRRGQVGLAHVGLRRSSGLRHAPPAPGWHAGLARRSAM